MEQQRTPINNGGGNGCRREKRESRQQGRKISTYFMVRAVPAVGSIQAGNVWRGRKNGEDAHWNVYLTRREEVVWAYMNKLQSTLRNVSTVVVLHRTAHTYRAKVCLTQIYAVVLELCVFRGPPRGSRSKTTTVEPLLSLLLRWYKPLLHIGPGNTQGE